MVIQKAREGGVLQLAIAGRLDATTAPQLETELKEALGGITDLQVDFAQVSYISSAGLRVILAVQKQMSKQGSMTIRNVNESVREVFEITGFLDILTII